MPVATNSACNRQVNNYTLCLANMQMGTNTDNFVLFWQQKVHPKPNAGPIMSQIKAAEIERLCARLYRFNIIIILCLQLLMI